MALEEFHSSDRVKATYLTGSEGRLVVSFTGIGKPDSRAQTEEFVGTSRQGGRNHVLFVADTLRSWYNEPGLHDEIVELVQRYCKQHDIEDVVTFGNSMGGYGAIMFAGPLGAKSALALSAQYSADPKIVPEEKRWMEYRDRIKTFTRPPMGEVLSDSCTYFVVHGGSALERPHWSRFPTARNFKHYLVDNVGHALGKKLKLSNQIKPLTEHAITVRPVAFRRTLKVVFNHIRKPEPTLSA